ncbi:hypothetical protein HU230_0024225 [Bradyrhizobium quebecense]|uniref:Uncharacterized protein n=1 Tax=Bradyrhizobium quebecense TaxID=2748629 RepID=A0A974ACL4_9BRAD|nr:hypothetical protein [Bradyrhizobium quebecense]UGA41486.1 hypothetical protein HU230_0024225 [Bradyrhizobium quebecense]
MQLPLNALEACNNPGRNNDLRGPERRERTRHRLVWSDVNQNSGNPVTAASVWLIGRRIPDRQSSASPMRLIPVNINDAEGCNQSHH